MPEIGTADDEGVGLQLGEARRSQGVRELLAVDATERCQAGDDTAVLLAGERDADTAVDADLHARHLSEVGVELLQHPARERVDVVGGHRLQMDGDDMPAVRRVLDVPDDHVVRYSARMGHNDLSCSHVRASR